MTRLASLWRELGRDVGELERRDEEHTSLVDDLGVDSLEILVLIDLAAHLWDVELPEQMDWATATLGDLHHYLELT